MERMDFVLDIRIPSGKIVRIARRLELARAMQFRVLAVAIRRAYRDLFVIEGAC